MKSSNDYSDACPKKVQNGKQDDSTIDVTGEVDVTDVTDTSMCEPEVHKKGPGRPQKKKNTRLSENTDSER